MPNDWVGAPYVRLYVTLADDRPALWASDELLAWYVRLLAGANAYYPASAPIPRDVPAVVLDSLESDEVLDVEGGRYRFHGLAKLRSAPQARGYRGGIARAATAIRVAGRFAGPDAVADDAGSSNSDAGPSLVDDAGPSLVSDAEKTTLVTSEPAKEKRESIDAGTPPYSRGTSVVVNPIAPAPAPAPAREDADDPSGPTTPAHRAAMVRDHGPDDARCDEPDLHPLHHRWYPGVGWVCLLCERSDPRSFDDRFIEAGGHPF